MTIKEQGEGGSKILGIFGDNVMGVKHISSPLHANGLHLFCSMRWSSLKSTKLAPTLSCPCQVIPPLECALWCPIMACSSLIIYFFLHGLVQKSPINTQNFCGRPSTLDVFWNCHIINHLPCSHTIFLQSPHLMTQTIWQICDNATLYISFLHKC